MTLGPPHPIQPHRITPRPRPFPHVVHDKPNSTNTTLTSSGEEGREAGTEEEREETPPHPTSPQPEAAAAAATAVVAAASLPPPPRPSPSPTPPLTSRHTNNLRCTQVGHCGFKPWQQGGNTHE